MGKEVAEYYLNEGRRALKDSGIDVPYELIYLEGQLMSSYLVDVNTVQDFAALNRLAIIDEIAKGTCGTE